jgi:hypothetical protein
MLIEKRELELEFFLADAVRFVPMDLCVVDCSVQQTNGCESFQFPPFATPLLPVEPCQIADSGARCDWLSIPDVSYNLEIHGYPEASTPLRIMAQRKSILSGVRHTDLPGAAPRLARTADKCLLD